MGVILHGVCYDTHMMTRILLFVLLGQAVTPVKVTDPTQPSVAVTTAAAGSNRRAMDVTVPKQAPKTTSVSCGVVATPVPATPLANRTSLCIYNASAGIIYFGPGTVTTASGFPLTAGAYWCDDVGPNTYSCIVAAATGEIRALEN